MDKIECYRSFGFVIMGDKGGVVIQNKVRDLDIFLSAAEAEGIIDAIRKILEDE